MTLTEEQAREKWCPFVRHGEGGIQPAANRWTTRSMQMNPESCRCIASDCMAWRWKPLPADDAWTAAVKKAAEELGDKSPSRVKAAKHVNANRAKYGLPERPYLGYCGLAGKGE